jgi:putative ABC transport system permease protein
MTDAGLVDARQRAFADGGMYVYEKEARERGWKVGDEIDVVFPNGPGTLTIQGFFTDKKPLPSSGNFIVSTTEWDAGFPDPQDSYVGVLKPDGVSTKQAQRVVERVADRFGGIDADNKAEFIDKQIAQLDQILNLMYALLLFAVVIALIGIVNTLALSVYERTREIGLLRAVGMSRVQLRRMIRGEALITASFGSLLGLAIGLFFGVMLVQALSSEDIGLAVPVFQLVVFVVLAGLAGLAAGIMPARRAARLDVLRAINNQ